MFINENQANTFLKQKASSKKEWQGISCECCVHRCTIHELDEYCGPIRRTKRRVLTPSHFTQRDLDDFYDQLDKLDSYPQPNYPDEVLDEMQELESQKLVNLGDVPSNPAAVPPDPESGPIMRSLGKMVSGIRTHVRHQQHKENWVPRNPSLLRKSWRRMKQDVGKY